MEFILYLFKILIFMIFIIILLYLSMRLNKSNIVTQSNKRYLNILERININKDSSFLVLKIGDEGCVVSTTSNTCTKIKDLTKEEIKKIEESQLQNQEEINKKISENLKKMNFENLKKIKINRKG